jgi:hypothetical protein
MWDTHTALATALAPRRAPNTPSSRLTQRAPTPLAHRAHRARAERSVKDQCDGRMSDGTHVSHTEWNSQSRLLSDEWSVCCNHSRGCIYVSV